MASLGRNELKQQTISWIIKNNFLDFFHFGHDSWPWPIDYLIRFRSISVVIVELAIPQPKMVRLPRNEKQTNLLNSRLQMWPSGVTLAMTLTLNFQGQIWNWLHLSQKWCDSHETKSKHIDCNLGLKCDHQIWPWSWPWPFIVKVICDLDHLVTKVRCKDLPDSDRGDFRCRHAIDSSSYSLYWTSFIQQYHIHM